MLSADLDRSQGIVMVCVTRQISCERLISRGEQAAQTLGIPMQVIYVARDGVDLLGKSSEGEALEYLFTKAKEAGAEMQMLRSNDVVETLITHAGREGAVVMVVGESRADTRSVKGFLKQLELRLPHVEIVVVPA